MNSGLKSLLGLALSCAITNGYAQTADSIKITVQGGGPAITTTNTTGTTATTLQLNSAVYPGTLGQGTTWAVMTGGTASGTISAGGLLTLPAQTSGYLWVKGTSVADPTKSDSIKVQVYCKASHTNPLNWFVIDTVKLLGTTLYSGTATLGNPGAYTLFPATGNTTGIIQQGASYTLSTQTTSYGSFAPDTTQYTYSISAWIDYNRNGIFESSEWLSVEDSALNRFANHTFTVPSGATPGPALMRVRSRLYGSSNGVSDMCLSITGSGQTEDYIVTIEALPTCSGEPGPNPGDLGCVSFIYNGKTVVYPAVRGSDGNVWLQKNLGAAQVATSISDAASYGDVFQWGRWADGHQLRTADTTSIKPTPNNPSGLITGNNKFLIGNSPTWWDARAITDTWNAATPSAATATNGCDPCRVLGNGWRLPFSTEWQAVLTAESITNITTAFASHLKLPGTGVRNSSGNYDFVGTRGYYWSNEPATSGGRYLYLSGNAQPTSGGPRIQGAAIRCIKSFKVDSVDVSTINNAPATIATYQGTLQLKDTVFPGYVNQNVTWSIIPTGFATVSNTGLVTAVADGTVWVKATSVQDPTKADSIQISISHQVVPVDSVNIYVTAGASPSITTHNGTLQMIGVVFPSNANQSVSWKILPVTGNATINISGLVTATANGTVWAKVTSVQDTTKSDSLMITISGQIVPVDSIDVKTAAGASTTISAKDGTLQMEAILYPATTNQSVTWSVVAATGTATIDNMGLLTANTDGTVWAKATSVQDASKSDSLLITITGQTGIADAGNDPGITLYPNPAKNHVLLKAAAHPAITLAIYNANGQQMSSHTIAENQLQHPYTIDISNYAPGLYMLRLITTTQHQNLLFTVEQ